MTCLGEPKVETQEALEVERLLEEIIWEIPVLLYPIVTDLRPHHPICKTFLTVVSGIGV